MAQTTGRAGTRAASRPVVPRVVSSDWIRQWVPSSCPDGGGGQRPAQPAAVSRRILGVLLSSRFRKGSIQAMAAEEFTARHLDLVTRRVRRGQPLQITLIGFPFKAPNPLKVGPRTLPDLAEVAAVATFARIHHAVQAVYPPGVEFIIIHDGTYIADALDVPRVEARAYAEYFGWLLRATEADGFIRSVDLVELMDAHSPGRSVAHGAAACGAADGVVSPDTKAVALRKTLGLLNVRSIPAGVYQASLSGDHDSLPADAAALRTRAWQAMERYEACDALLHRFDPRPLAFPEAIHATTRSQPGRLALWLVRRGRGLLPWHAVGVVRGRRLDVRPAVDLEGSPAYRPVFLEGEASPFCYEAVGF